MTKFRFLLYSFFLFAFSPAIVYAQKTFTVGSESYTTGYLAHQYLYEYTFNIKDSFKTKLIDSVISYASPDSSVTLQLNFPLGSSSVYKTANYYNKYKKITKTIVYTNNTLQSESKWVYDDVLKRKISFEDNNIANSTTSKETYDYANDKINGDLIVTVASYKNNKVEYYNKEYYDKNMRKYKEVRLNDNKKDIMHTETFIYVANGKLLERSIYFNEFKTTKTFKETDGTSLPKCFKNFPLILKDRITSATKEQFLKQFLKTNQTILLDHDCNDFEYSYKSFGCEVIVKTNQKSKSKQLLLCIKDRVN